MQKSILSLLSCLIILSSSSVKPPLRELKWSALNKIPVKLKHHAKPVLIDVYTDWCHWCKVMDKKTYGNQKVADYLSENFYISKVNAETKEIFLWANKKYDYNNKYFINEFTLYATNGQPGFPATAILISENSKPISISGYLKPKELEPILKYFGEGEYLVKTFTEYKKTFKASW